MIIDQHNVKGCCCCCCCSVAKLCLTLCDPMNCRHTSLPCRSPSLWICSNSCPVSDAIQPFHPLSPSSPLALNLSASGSFPMTQFLASGGQNIGTSALASSNEFSSVQFSRSVMSDSLWPHESQHTRLPCPSLSAGVYSNSHPLNWWCHPTISSSVTLFSSCP